jgi:hypothetical protein
MAKHLPLFVSHTISASPRREAIDGAGFITDDIQASIFVEGESIGDASDIGDVLLGAPRSRRPGSEFG